MNSCNIYIYIQYIHFTWTVFKLAHFQLHVSVVLFEEVGHGRDVLRVRALVVHVEGDLRLLRARGVRQTWRIHSTGVTQGTATRTASSDCLFNIVGGNYVTIVT